MVSGDSDRCPPKAGVIPDALGGHLSITNFVPLSVSALDQNDCLLPQPHLSMGQDRFASL